MNLNAITRFTKYKLLRDISGTFAATFLSTLVATLVVLVVPKVIGVVEYGYWQLYMFYTAYVGFMHFGWNDGIYLRYGGKCYDELEKPLLSSQFYMLCLQQTLLAAVVIVVAITHFSDANRMLVVVAALVCMVLTNVRFMLLYILQSTSRIGDYVKTLMVEQVVYCSLITISVLVGVRTFRPLLVADLVAKLVSLSIAIYICRDLIVGPIAKVRFAFTEAKENIRVGIKLMIANIASLLIIGVVRLGIERTWDLATFGKVSLTLSISNLVMLFINAIGLVLFPILRRIGEDKLPNIYVSVRTLLSSFSLGLLLSYYPIKILISNWLPSYSESMIYMAMLFPITLSEGKMSLLVNTYLKALRKERLLAQVNIGSLVLSVAFTIIATRVLHNLDLAIMSITMISLLRCSVADIYLAKCLRVPAMRHLWPEWLITVSFVVIQLQFASWLGAGLYGVIYLSYLMVKRKQLGNQFRDLRLLVAA